MKSHGPEFFTQPLTGASVLGSQPKGTSSFHCLQCPLGTQVASGPLSAAVFHQVFPSPSLLHQSFVARVPHSFLTHLSVPLVRTRLKGNL